jgi:TatA/E family protein of Tat protein translocase
MFGVGDAELFILAVLALLLFGSKLPSVMGKLGRGLSHFKRSMDDVRQNVHKSIEDSDRK